MATRPVRTITDAEKQMLLSITQDDITKELLDSLFTDYYDSEKNKITHSKFNTYDVFTLKKGESFNKEDVLTNCGLLIVNKYLFENGLEDVVGYINTPFDNKTIGKIGDKIISYVLKDESGDSIPIYIDYMNRLCWLSFSYNTEVCSSLTMKSIKPIPKITAEKNRLVKENKDALANGDVNVAVDISEELVQKAREELKNDPSYELYESGARGAFDNAYRQAQIMKGPVYNPQTGKFDIMTNSLYEGAEKKDLPAMANAVVDGMYTKAIGPGICGYMAKKLIATYQSVQLAEHGSDCKSKGYLSIKLTDAMKNLFMYVYMVEGDKTVLLDDTNFSKYVGKTIKYRSPMVHGKGDLCNKCAGERYYMLNIKNIGLTSGRVANQLLQYKMKASHDTTVRHYAMKPDEVFVKQ